MYRGQCDAVQMQTVGPVYWYGKACKVTYTRSGTFVTAATGQYCFARTGWTASTMDCR